MGIGGRLFVDFVGEVDGDVVGVDTNDGAGNIDWTEVKESVVGGVSEKLLVCCTAVFQGVDGGGVGVVAKGALLGIPGVRVDVVARVVESVYQDVGELMGFGLGVLGNDGDVAVIEQAGVLISVYVDVGVDSDGAPGTVGVVDGEFAGNAVRPLRQAGLVVRNGVVVGGVGVAVEGESPAAVGEDREVVEPVVTVEVRIGLVEV